MYTQTTSKDTRKAHDVAVTRTQKHLLVSEAVWTLSPPQKLPLGISMNNRKIESAQGTMGRGAVSRS